MRIDLCLQKFKFRLAQTDLLCRDLFQKFVDLIDHGIHGIAECRRFHTSIDVGTDRQISLGNLIRHLAQFLKRPRDAQRNQIRHDTDCDHNAHQSDQAKTEHPGVEFLVVIL